MTRAIHCARVLTDGVWRSDLTLILDEHGFIQSMKEGRPREEAQGLAGIVIPGMPNLHSHGFQRLVAGLGGIRTGGDSFWTWRRAMYELAGRLEPDQLYACMAGVFLDMLRGGFTSCAEFHYLHNDPEGRPYEDPSELGSRVMAAADHVGIGLTLLPVLYCRSGLGQGGVEAQQRRFHLTPDRYEALLHRCRERPSAVPGNRVGLAPHSLRAVSGEELAALLALRRPGEPVHVHVAEQPAEVDDCLRYLGARPLAWLLDHIDVDEQWCLVHATHLDDGELARGASSGAVAGLCPTTEADLGDGTFRATDWVAAGGAFGVGTDSNLRLSATEELRQLEFSQRLRDGARNLLARTGSGNGQSLWTLAARGGAQALGQAVGRIAPGCRADLVELDPGHPLLAGLDGDAVLDAFVFPGGSEMIESVWVAGSRRLHRGRHERQEAIEAEFLRTAGSLRA